MSDSLGLPTYGGGGASPFLGREVAYMGGQRDYSEDAAQVIDDEVKRILEESYDHALKIVRENAFNSCYWPRLTPKPWPRS